MKPRLIIIGQAVQSDQVLQNCNEYFDVLRLANIEEFTRFLNLNNSSYTLWVHFDSKITHATFNNLSEPDFILTTTTGLTHFSEEILERFTDRILHLATEREFLKSITSTAEHAWSLIMACTSPWLYFRNEINNVGRSELIRRFQLSSRKIGIIGYGRLGRMITEYALAFGMQVHVFEIDQSVEVPLKRGVIRHEKLEKLLNSCDIVSLHASATYPCREILSREMLDQCKTGVIIVNSSRGCLVDENYISTLIDSGLVETYATDVLSEEEVGADSSPNSLKMRSKIKDRVIITPHIGGANIEAMNLCEQNLLSRLVSRVQSQS